VDQYILQKEGSLIFNDFRKIRYAFLLFKNKVNARGPVFITETKPVVEVQQLDPLDPTFCIEELKRLVAHRDSEISKTTNG
jgi:hypothetical protein